MERRAAARQARFRRRRTAALVAAAIAAIAAVALVGSLGDGSTPKPAPTTPTRHAVAAAAVVDGGPLAPASVGGLAALWAPQNVVGSQPGTAAAYSQASKLSGLPGFLLIADRGNNRILVVDPQGNVAFRFPTAADLAAGRKLYYNDDTFVEPGGRYLIANEEDNHAIVQVGIDHSFQVLFGRPGHMGSSSTLLNTPDDAYGLTDGSFTVADAYNCRILFIKAHTIVRQIGQTGVCRHNPPETIGAVNGDTPLPGGGVLVSEINGSWIDAFGPNGKLEYSIRAPVNYPSDPQPLPGGRILIADYSNPGAILIIDRSGRVLWRYGPSAGPGRLDHPSLAMGLPNGDIAVNDDYRERVVVIDPRLNRIVWQYGHTDSGGTGPGYLHIPDGMDFVPAVPDLPASLATLATWLPDWAAVVHP